MPTFEAERDIEQSPESIWRTLLSMEEWPEWSPMFQHVEFHEPARRMDGEWTLHGLLGRVPYNGTFRLIEHRPVERLSFTSISVSPPYEFVRHQVTIENGSGSRLKWRVDYGTSGGPGGWIIDRLLIRRRTPQLLVANLRQFG
ncbi:MAG: SRPBCC family protein [Chloroflexota bacterium]